MSWWLGIEHLSYEKNDIKWLAVVRNVDDFQMMPRINGILQIMMRNLGVIIK